MDNPIKEKGNAYKNTMSIQNTKIFSSSEILQHVYHADIRRVIIHELFFGCLCVQHLQLQTSSIMKRPARAEHATATTRMAEVYGGGFRWCRSLYRIIPRRIRAPTNKICVELGKQEGNISSRSRISVSWTVADLHCKTVYARLSFGRIFFIFCKFWPNNRLAPPFKLAPPLKNPGSTPVGVEEGRGRGPWCPCIRIDFMSSPHPVVGPATTWRNAPTKYLKICRKLQIKMAFHKVWGKVIFSVACVKNSLHGGGVCLSACWDTPPRDQAPPWDQAPPGADTPQTRHPLHSACWEIRSTSGRYASYWNAILLVRFLKKFSAKMFKILFDLNIIVLPP